MASPLSSTNNNSVFCKQYLALVGTEMSNLACLIALSGAVCALYWEEHSGVFIIVGAPHFVPALL
jgi:hypothetical protein